MLCVTRRNSTRIDPTATVCFGATSMSRPRVSVPCSSSLRSTSASVNAEPYTGPSMRERTCATAPM